MLRPAGQRDTAYDDLPVRLLQKLDLNRPMYNRDIRPACAGTLDPGFTVTSSEPFPLAAARKAAWRFCLSCPLRAECDRYADERKEVGVWGGKLRQRNGWSAYRITDLLADMLELPA